MAIGDNTLLGYNSSIGIAEETTYGTKVDSFSYLEFNSEGFSGTEEELKLGSINGGRDFIKRLQLGQTVEGSIEADFNAAEDAVVYICKQAMGGTVTSSSLSTGGYSHVLKVGDMESNADTTTSYVKSLTVQVDKGGRVWDVTGVRVNTLTIKGEVGSPVMFTAEMIGQQFTATSSTPVASFSNIVPLEFTNITYQRGDSSGNLSTEKIQSFELTISNNLDGDQRELGSKSISKLPPLRREVMLKVTQRFDTTTAYDDWLGVSVSAIRIQCTSSDVIGTTGGVYQLQIDCDRAYHTQNPIPQVGGFDVLSQEIEFSCLSNNTTTAVPVQLTVQNATASY